MLDIWLLSMTDLQICHQLFGWLSANVCALDLRFEQWNLFHVIMMIILTWITQSVSYDDIHSFSVRMDWYRLNTHAVIDKTFMCSGLLNVLRIIPLLSNLVNSVSFQRKQKAYTSIQSHNPATISSDPERSRQGESIWIRHPISHLPAHDSPFPLTPCHIENADNNRTTTAISQTFYEKTQTSRISKPWWRTWMVMKCNFFWLIFFVEITILLFLLHLAVFFSSMVFFPTWRLHTHEQFVKSWRFFP